MLILKFSKKISLKIFLSTSSNLHFILNYNLSTRRNPFTAYSTKKCKQWTDKHHSCNHLFHFVFQIFLHVFLSISFVFHLHFICLHQKRALHKRKLFLFHLCNVPFTLIILICFTSRFHRHENLIFLRPLPHEIRPQMVRHNLYLYNARWKMPYLSVIPTDCRWRNLRLPDRKSVV